MPRKAVTVAAKVPTVARATKVKAAANIPTVQAFNPFAHIEDEIDNMEKKFGLTSMSISEVEDRFDSGLLCVNLQTAGGLLAGGWYTFFGGEQSCKTTLATCVLGSITRQEDFLGRSAFFDYEGSFSAEYAENMWRYAGNGRAKTVDNVFGVKDNNGNWIVKPRVRYYTPSVGEDFFNYVAKLEKALPDVVLLDGSFYYLFENTKANQKLVSGRYDKDYFRRFNKFKVPAANGLPQAIILVDSYPAMLPGRMDEKDEGTDGLASQARMFSDGIKRIKGAMKRKRIVVLGINQLRSVPMAMYGPTEQEPCGTALRFFCMGADTHLITENGMLTAREYHEALKLPRTMGVSGLEKPVIFAPQGMSQIVKVTTAFGNFISGKPGHRVQTIVGGGFRPAWTALKDFSAGRDTWVPVKVGADVWSKKNPTIDFEYVSTSGNETVDISIPKASSESLAYVLGYLVAEGCFIVNRVIFSNNERDVIDHYIECLVDVFGFDADWLSSKVKIGNKETYVLDISSKRLASFFAHLGMHNKSRDKKVPRIIRTGTREQVIAFFAAYAEGDASISNKSVSYVTRSSQLAVELQQLLLNLGVVCTVVKKHGKYFKQKHLNALYKCSMHGRNARKFCETVGFLSKKRRQAVSQFARGFYINDTKDGSILPDLLTQNDRSLIRFNEMLKDKLLHRGKYFRTRFFTESKWKEMYEWASSMRTSHERDKYIGHLDELKEFIDYTIKNNLAWVKVTGIDTLQEEQMTYDGTMPDTHTFVTNGIISHNSDVRFRMSSISIPHGKGAMEEEDSLSGEGVDTYRYIKCKAYKNKLGGPQGSEMILRIRVSDANGTASGFCRVWDCWNYLKETGQISGQRNKIKFGEGTPFAGKTVSWMEFKALIDGDKDLIKKGCDKLIPGKKPLRLYEWCRHQIASGKGYSLYLENIKNKNTAKKAKKAVAIDGEDEE